MIRRIRPHVEAALPGWVVARILVVGTLGFAHLMAKRLDPLPDWSLRHLDEGLMGWDAVRYEEIARLGYEALPDRELRFFPLLPLVGRGLGFLFGGQYGFALLLIASASALAFGALLHRLVLLEREDDLDSARRVTWFVALAPAAFVLAWGYSEALAGALTAAGFLFLRQRKWWWAAATGVLIGLVRPVGLFFVVPAAVEALRAVRRSELPARLAAVAAPAVGCALYLGWVGLIYGDPMLPFTVQEEEGLRGPAANPLDVLGTAVSNVFSGELRGNALHAPWIGLAVLLIVLAARRLPASYTAFSAVTVVVALSSGNLSSFERYTFTTVPILVAAAVVLAEERVERSALAIGAGTMAVFGTLSILGSYVP
ncbi:MAG TPA: hypothetical protein VHF47_03535 [Acidimicrobiales bacterium]|nr:hypothetical protein [Acidimicrobiales bacterium]